MARELTQEEQKLAAEHQDVLLAARAIITTKQGRKLFKYLLKSFEVSNPIPRNLDQSELQRYLGFHEAGTSLFKLLSEADSLIASGLLAEIEKDRQDEIYQASLT